MTKKLLTITIPVYNTEKYIKRCLDSLLIDEYFELLDILVISDGSPDHSVDIIKEYVEKYPKVIRLIEKENGGHGSVINRGIKEARGEYFRVLDSDDWFDKRSFGSFIKKLIDIDASLVITNSIIEHVYKNEQVKEDYYNILKYDEIVPVDAIDYQKIEGYDIVSLANATFKTKLLKESKVTLNEKCYYEDLQYDLFFLKFVDNYIALNLYVYHYFIGRPEQSVSPISALNHYDDRLKITVSLVKKSDELLRSNIEKCGKQWLINSLLRHIYIHYKFMLNMNLNKATSHTIELNGLIHAKYSRVEEELCKKYLYLRFVFHAPSLAVGFAKCLKCLKK